MPAHTAVLTESLTHRYPQRKRMRNRREGGRLALDGIDLEVEPGAIHGVLGPNGAGKTTLVKILSTLLIPTAGRATVLGLDVVRDVRQVRESIGIVLGGDRGMYTRLSGRHNLRHWANMYHVPRAEVESRVQALLDLVGLSAAADKPAETYSRGMKQRLHLARGLVGDPRLVLLDEPTLGMDPVAAREVREIVLQLRAQGKTVLLTTHDMAEAEALCDRITLLDNGTILATQTPSELTRTFGDIEMIEVSDASPAVLDQISQLDNVGGVVANGSSARIEFTGSPRPIMERFLELDVMTARVIEPSLEEVYVRVFGDRGMGTDG